MVWYNPATWGKSTSVTVQTISPVVQTGTQSAPRISGGEVSAPIQATRNSAGSWSTSGTSSQTYTTTADTGTGYNPATRVQEGTPKVSTQQTSSKNNLLSAQTIQREASVSSINAGSTSTLNKPLWGLGDSFKQFGENFVYDVKIALGQNLQGKSYRSLTDPFYYSSEQRTTGGGIKLIPVNPMQSSGTIISKGDRGAYPFVTERVGTGAFIAKYGETGVVIGGSIVAPELTSAYLLTSGLAMSAKGRDDEAGLRIVGGLIYPFSRAIKLPNEITNQQIIDVVDRPNKNIGIRIESGNKFVDYYQSEKATPTAEMITTTRLAGIQTGERIAVVGGRSTATVKTFDFGSRFSNDWKDIYVSTSQKIKGVSVNLPESNGVTPALSMVKTNKLMDVSQITSRNGANVNIKLYSSAPDNLAVYGSVTKMPENYVASMSGKLAYTERNAFNQPTGFGFDVTDTSLLKRVKLPEFSNRGTVSTSSSFSAGTTTELAPSFQSAVTTASNKGLKSSFNLGSSRPTSNIFSGGGTVQIEVPKTSSVSRIGVMTTGRTVQLPDTSQIKKTVSVTVPRSTMETRVGSGVETFTATVPVSRQATRTIQATINSPTTVSVPAFPSFPTFPGALVPILPDFPDFGFSEKSRKRKIRGKRSFKYTPSYEAFVFNIRGRAPRGMETGARVRPIPKGFSFANKLPKFKFKMPRLKF